MLGPYGLGQAGPVPKGNRSDADAGSARDRPQRNRETAPTNPNPREPSAPPPSNDEGARGGEA